jgi:hypothetical protein
VKKFLVSLVTFLCSFLFASQVHAFAFTISGHITDSFGNPVANKAIYFANPAFGNQPTTTDANGNYTKDLYAGDYTLHIQYNQIRNTPGGFSTQGVNVAGDITIDTDTSLDIVLPFHTVTVHVQDPNNSPVQGVQVGTNEITTTFSLPGLSNVVAKSYFGSAYTDDNGNAQLILIPTDTTGYSIFVNPGYYMPYQSAQQDNVFVTDDLSLTIPIIFKPAIHGQITDEQGNPIAATISLNGPTGPTGFKTDSLGNYFEPLNPGTYQVQISFDSLLPDSSVRDAIITGTLDFTGVDTLLNIHFPFKHVTVHVTNQQGQPIQGTDVSSDHPTESLSIDGLSNVTGASIHGYTYTDANGNATLLLFPTTSTGYSIRANTSYLYMDPNYFPKTITGVQVITDRTVDITLDSKITVSGKIVDANNLPITEATINVFNQMTNAQVQTQTDAQGNYSVTIGGNQYPNTFFIGGNSTANTPSLYQVYGSVVFDHSQTFNIALPFRQELVHVRDSLGNPVNASLHADTGSGVTSGAIQLAINGMSAVRGVAFDNQVTNTNGDSILFLFPTTAAQNNNLYTIVVTPQDTSLPTIQQPNVTVDNNGELTIAIPTITPTPTVTPSPTITLTPTPTVSPTPTIVLIGPPTNKDQCKKGGWALFNNPVFKNQGDCVSYVSSRK